MISRTRLFRSFIVQRRGMGATMGKMGKDTKNAGEKTNTNNANKSSTGSESSKQTNEAGSKFGTNTKWGKSMFSDVYGTLKETKQSLIDHNASRYGGLTSKAFRNEIKKQRLRGFEGTSAAASASTGADGSGAESTMAANPEAGAGIVLHKDSKWKESWNAFKDSNPVLQGIFTMRRRVEESDNPVVNAARFVTERLRFIFGDAFEENEHAQTIAEIKAADPDFDLEVFMKDAREFMVPEVLEAFVYWDPKTLKEWCSDAVFSVLSTSRDPLIAEGLEIDGKILDLRNVDLVMAKIMDGVPLLILSFKTQQIEVVKNLKGEVVGGSEDGINDVYYIWALTKDAEKPNPLTKGWKIVEFAIQGVRESY